MMEDGSSSVPSLEYENAPTRCLGITISCYVCIYRYIYIYIPYSSLVFDREQCALLISSVCHLNFLDDRVDQTTL